MLMPVAVEATVLWSNLINSIIYQYFSHKLTLCILWHPTIDFLLNTFATTTPQTAILSMQREKLRESFQLDIYNFSALEEKFISRDLPHNNFVLKLTAAIQDTYCEGFIAFQDDIPIFAEALRKAIIYSTWRMQQLTFLFAYFKDVQERTNGTKEDQPEIMGNVNPYFNDILFIEQPNILIIEADSHNATILDLKTNKFIGSLDSHPEQLYLLNRYDVTTNKLLHTNNMDLYPNKVKNLGGREIIMCAFDYRPFVVYDYEMQPQWHDWAIDNPKHGVHIDGIEVRLLLTFCEIHNCTVQVDTSEKGDWGVMYPNATGIGLMGMVQNRTAHMALGSLYTLETDYIETTTFIGRSGVSCLVPRPMRTSSWTLLFKPFQLTLWLGVFTCMLLESVSLFVVNHAEDRFLEKPTNWLDSLKFGYSTTLKLLISQGSTYNIMTPSTRIVLLACYLIDIIITSIYGGGLSSILTVPTLGEAADSVERLSKHNLMWSATSEYWVASLEGVTEPVIANIVRNFRVYNFDDMREYAKTENMGFAVERLIFGHFGNGEFLTEEALGRLKLMEDDIYYEYTLNFVPRTWALLGEYNELIMVWHAAGLDRFWEWKIIADFVGERAQERVSGSVSTDFGSDPVELGMDNFAGLISVWLAGIIVSILGFVFEWIYFRKFDA